MASKKVSAGLKHDADKPSLELIDRTALVELAKVLDFGAKKYSAHNWRKGIQWSRVIGAALRHIEAFNDGENFDQETGLCHLAHAMCCCMFALNYFHTHPELDDRHTAGAADDSKLVRPELQEQTNGEWDDVRPGGLHDSALNIPVWDATQAFEIRSAGYIPEPGSYSIRPGPLHNGPTAGREREGS